MRRARFIVEGAALCRSRFRVVDNHFILRDEEKRFFPRRLERFSGSEIITY